MASLNVVYTIIPDKKFMIYAEDKDNSRGDEKHMIFKINERVGPASYNNVKVFEPVKSQ